MKSLSSALPPLAVLVSAAGLIRFPKEVARAVQDGLTLCTGTLLPTLFPFLILSIFLVRSGLLSPLSKTLERVMKPVFHLPGACASAFLLGLLGGYPTGAKTAISLYKEGLCSRQEAEHTLSFCNNCGPGFLLGSVGFGMFGQGRYGAMLLAIHATAAVMTGILLSTPHHHGLHSHESSASAISCSPASDFVHSVTEAMRAFIDLSAFVLCFSAILCVVQNWNGFPLLAAWMPFSDENNSALLLGLLEMTNGALRVTGGSQTERLILVSALTGWGGLSVHCQVLSLIQDTDLSPKLYFKGKALHASLCALLTAVFFSSYALPYISFLCLFCAGVHFRKKAVEKKSRVYYNMEQAN